MLIRKAYRFQLVTSEAQHHRLLVLTGCARFVWNAALAECHRILKAGERLPGYNGYGGYASWIGHWKSQPETAFLKEAYTDNLQQKLMDLDRAWKDCFDKNQPNKREPQFKSRRNERDSSIRFVNFKKYCELQGRRVKLPAGLGWLRFRKSRDIQGDIKNCTITREAGQWFISFQTEINVPEPVHPATSAVGIDMGVSKLFALSDGSVIEPIATFKSHQDLLARLQRRLAKKQKFSANWKKLKQKITRLHRKTARCRADYLHKSTTALSKNHAMIVIEDLQVKNMSASAKGDLAQPGKNVRQKTGLNRAILDQGWHEARRQLQYKQNWRGGLLIAVPPRHTSQRCNACGHTEPGNRCSQSVFVCVACGHTNNADINAARNILAAGHAVIACGEAGLLASVKQEPVRNREAVAPRAAAAAQGIPHRGEVGEDVNCSRRLAARL